ncbi:STAS/SEC14 domain-containing protein [uncultured Pontibacter sp.]|uniref:STAS/SEC14 domain-containing protein n=1 Tax=uncultured Pontibacter sp. TaxID=453356 RepID=UPI0026083D94|nr:STAS/SEC14 domain-containing protein [uncultured Pontibacter sp.]
MAKVAELTSSTGKVFLTVEYDEVNNWVYNCWNGYVSPENIRQGCLAVLEAFQYQESVCILNDNRQLVGRWDDSVEWIEKEWMPRALRAGLLYFAHVANQESFAAASAAQLSSRTHGLFEMCIFGDLQQAQKWLKACQQAGQNHL